MKRVALLLALAFALVALPGAPAYGDASQSGCEHSHGKADGCYNGPVTVPEPNSFALLGVGLAAVGGLAVAFKRKRLVQN